MSMENQKRCNVGRLIAGAALTFVVSFATAAVVALMPGAATQNGEVAANQSISTIDEYVLLHQSRSAVVPSYMRINVPDQAR